jgi:hypothetical protein
MDGGQPLLEYWQRGVKMTPGKALVLDPAIFLPMFFLQSFLSKSPASCPSPTMLRPFRDSSTHPRRIEKNKV